MVKFSIFCVTRIVFYKLRKTNHFRTFSKKSKTEQNYGFTREFCNDLSTQKPMLKLLFCEGGGKRDPIALCLYSTTLPGWRRLAVKRFMLRRKFQQNPSNFLPPFLPRNVQNMNRRMCNTNQLTNIDQT